MCSRPGLDQPILELTMPNPARNLAGREGFTLIELLVAMTVLLVGVLGVLAIIDRANAATVTTRSREAATNVARELVEAARSVPYANLTPASVETQIQALPGLADDGAPAGWTIRRRGFTFTATATVCTFDDARDAGGDHSAGNFCADSAAPSATPDRNPEDYRRVRVEVRWTVGGVEREVHQTVLINNPGSAGAPAVRTLLIESGSAAIAPGTNQVIHPTETLRFLLTTSSRPTTLHWLLDGASQAPITEGANLAWNFQWELGPSGQDGTPDPEGSIVDGTYVVSAEAFDQYGVAGPSRSLTVSLNRSPADKVTGVAGGRTGNSATPADQVIDIEWLPSRERDIIGYSVERVDAAGNRVEVCERDDRTSCIDHDPPVEDGLTYYVFAWDVDPDDGQPRKGPEASDPLIVRLTNNEPFAPPTATATLQSDGSVLLTWFRPIPEDLDPGDSIAFYRIYRDGTGYDARYAVWNDPGATAQFVDGNTGGTAHEYWITAVDENFAESAPVPADWTP
jgi:prepilin-type N-terminal cleavage/methylation domain-containing protein